MLELFRNKKGFEFFTNWVTILFVAILVLSFLLSIIIINVWVSLLIIIITGVILGHFIFTSKLENRFPYFVLSFAFISGYLIGHRVGNVFILLAAFVGTVYLTNKVLHYTK